MDPKVNGRKVKENGSGEKEKKEEAAEEEKDKPLGFKRKENKKVMAEEENKPAVLDSWFKREVHRVFGSSWSSINSHIATTPR